MEYWVEKIRDRASEQRGASLWHNIREQWEKRKGEAQNEKRKFHTKLVELNRQIEELDNQYRNSLSKWEQEEERINKAEYAVKNSESKIESVAKDVLQSSRDVHALSDKFAKINLDLKLALDKAKLPESVAREFFDEIADGEFCICDREITDEIREVIRESAKTHLDSDEFAFLNAMKSAISDKSEPIDSRPANMLSKELLNLQDSVEELNRNRKRLEGFQYAATESDPKIKEAFEKKTRLEVQRESVIKNFNRFDGEDTRVDLERITKCNPNDVYAIDTIDSVIEEIDRKIDEITNLREIGSKKELLEKTIDLARTNSRQLIFDEIRDEANKRIKKLMPHNNIEIETIDNGIVLSGQSGGSGGETLSVGYAYLSTLFDRTDQHNLPFVVDSPANPIDFDIRASIGKIIPKLTGQFIAFVISPEKGNFIDSIRETKGDGIRYMTLFNKNGGRFSSNLSGVSTRVESKDGYLIVDEQFFNEFQEKQEEA